MDPVQIAEVVASAIGVFAFIAQFTPNSAAGNAANTILRVVNILGMNNGKAKNDPNA